GLFFGHPEPGVFRERAERLVVGIAAQAAIAIDNARLYEHAHRAADRFLRQLEFTRAITSSLGEGVYAIDQEGPLTHMNSAAETILGWKESELRGRVIHEVIHFRDPRTGAPMPARACRLLEVIRTGMTIRSDSDVFIRRDGTSFPVSFISSPIVREGKVAGAV